MPLERYLEAFDHRDWLEPTDEGPLRLAIVGLGQFARSSALPALRDATFCTPSALVSSSREKAEDVAESFGVDRVLDYEAFLDGTETEAYDAAYVATPNATHPEFVEAAAEHGIHVICEKPLAADSDDARRMVERCDEADVTLMTAYRLQAEPAVRRTREVYRDGVIGDLVQIHASFSSHVLDYGGPDQWRLDREMAGGGAMVDIGIYPLNTVRFLLDEDPVAVQATTSSHHEAFESVDEHVAFQLLFPGDVTASCTASFNAQPASGLVLLGTEGRIRIESPFAGNIPQDIHVECGDVGMEYTGPPVDEIVEEFDYFANHVLTGRAPEPDGRDGLTDLEVIEAIYDSAETGERVEV